MKKTFFHPLAAAIALSAAALCTGGAQAQSGNPIKIGFVTELTGPWTFFGTSCVAGPIAC